MMNKLDAKTELLDLSYRGDWKKLLNLLEKYPEYIDDASYPKGYTSLHQAAWHGAEIPVIGGLLRLGACPQAKTKNKSQTPREIALERHPHREDLHFLLNDKGRTLSQIMRKVASENADIFEAYDGNRVVLDRMVEFFSECYYENADSAERIIYSAYLALAGDGIKADHRVHLDIGIYSALEASSEFWASTFSTRLHRYYDSGRIAPIERHWASMADLFYMGQDGWGLRGDPFLYTEMRQSLIHVPLPRDAEEVSRLIYMAFETLTGASLIDVGEVFVERFSRGGMSSGYVCGEYWRKECVPRLKKRMLWLTESWGNI